MLSDNRKKKKNRKKSRLQRAAGDFFLHPRPMKPTGSGGKLKQMVSTIHEPRHVVFALNKISHVRLFAKAHISGSLSLIAGRACRRASAAHPLRQLRPPRAPLLRPALPRHLAGESRDVPNPTGSEVIFSGYVPICLTAFLKERCKIVRILKTSKKILAEM